MLASRPAFGLRLNLTNSASTLPFSRLAQCSFPLWARCSLMRPCRTFDIGGFVVCRYQHSTLQLLPAGATVAGWVIFLPLDQRALFTAHEIFGLASPTKPQPETVRLSLKRSRLNLYALTSNAFASTSLIALGLWQGSVISTLIPRSTDSTIPLITARVCTLSSALARCGRASERQFNEISA